MREEAWNRYPQRLPEELRARIAAAEGFPREGVWLGNGSNLILQWIFEAYGGPGRRALVPRPSFSLYRMWGRVSETEVEEFPLEGLFEYRAEAIARRVLERAPALTVLCLPNNPTGSELPPGEVSRIAEAAERVGGLVVVDEAYREFSGGSTTGPRWPARGPTWSSSAPTPRPSPPPASGWATSSRARRWAARWGRSSPPST
jgi:histidinol-phosphate aminotransferase